MQDPSHALRNLIVASRVPAMLMLSLGQRISFRYHLPLQLLATAWHAVLNWQLCSHCSQPLQVKAPRPSHLTVHGKSCHVHMASQHAELGVGLMVYARQYGYHTVIW